MGGGLAVLVPLAGAVATAVAMMGLNRLAHIDPAPSSRTFPASPPSFARRLSSPSSAIRASAIN